MTLEKKIKALALVGMIGGMGQFTYHTLFVEHPKTAGAYDAYGLDADLRKSLYGFSLACASIIALGLCGAYDSIKKEEIAKGGK